MMGKIIGGGLPVGAIGGSESIMSCLDPRNRGALWHSGTFNGNPLTCAAGVVSVRELTQERIDTMDRLGDRLARELKKAAMAVELPFSVRRIGSLMNVFFLNEPPPPTIARDDAKLIARVPSCDAEPWPLHRAARDDCALDRDDRRADELRSSSGPRRRCRMSRR